MPGVVRSGAGPNPRRLFLVRRSRPRHRREKTPNTGTLIAVTSLGDDAEQARRNSTFAWPVGNRTSRFRRPLNRLKVTARYGHQPSQAGGEDSRSPRLTALLSLDKDPKKLTYRRANHDSSAFLIFLCKRAVACVLRLARPYRSRTAPPQRCFPASLAIRSSRLWEF